MHSTDSTMTRSLRLLMPSREIFFRIPHIPSSVVLLTCCLLCVWQQVTDLISMYGSSYPSSDFRLSAMARYVISQAILLDYLQQSGAAPREFIVNSRPQVDKHLFMIMFIWIKRPTQSHPPRNPITKSDTIAALACTTTDTNRKAHAHIGYASTSYRIAYATHDIKSPTSPGC